MKHSPQVVIGGAPRGGRWRLIWSVPSAQAPPHMRKCAQGAIVAVTEAAHEKRTHHLTDNFLVTAMTIKRN
jgi:hypothetical protein